MIVPNSPPNVETPDDKNTVAKLATEATDALNNLDVLTKEQKLQILAAECDTPNRCKLRAISNQMRCCNICVDKLNIQGNHPYKWRFYEYLEMPKWAPLGTFPKLELPTTNQQPNTEKVGEKDLAILMVGDCPLGETDDFILPCCRPCEESPVTRRKVIMFRRRRKILSHTHDMDQDLIRTTNTNTTRL